MTPTLLLQPHQDGRWRVMNSAGIELAAPGGRATATSWAIRYLYETGGGSYRMRMPDGSFGQPVPVTGRSLTAVHQEANPPGVEREQDWQEPVKKIAELADQTLGRSQPPDPNGQISDIEITSTNRTVRLVNTHVSVFAAWSALVGFLFAGGTVSGIITPALQATSSKATVGSYVTFGNAFLATVSLSVCTAIVWY